MSAAPPTPSESDGDYLPSLDGWRAIAVSMVLFAHGSKAAEALPWDIGYTGVTLFFILSGFLITRRLLTAYSDGDRIRLRLFYLQRAFRLLPPLLAYLAVLAVLTGFGILHVSGSELTASLFFFRNYAVIADSPSFHGWFTGHFWSLAVEEHYYLLWPLTLHLVGRKRMLPFALLAAFGFAAWRWFGWAHPVSITWATAHVPYFFRTDTRLDSLLIGSALALALSKPAWASRMRRAFSSSDLILVVATLLMVWWRFNTGFIRIPEELLLAGLLMLTVSCPKLWLHGALCWQPLRWIGRLSYGLYLWQQLFLVTELSAKPLGLLNSFPLNLLLVFAAALVSYFCIERPAIRFGKSLRGAQQLPAPAVAPLAFAD